MMAFYGYDRLAYLNMPKAACTTIRNVLNFLETGKRLADPLLVHEQKPLLKIADGAFTFTFIRDPRSRIKSCFADKIWRVHHYSFQELRSHLAIYHGLEFIDGSYLNDLSKFLDFVATTKTRFFCGGDHWQSQAEIIHRSQVPIEFIGLVEHLQVHLSLVLSMAGIEKELGALPNFNSATHPPPLTTPEIEEKIRNIYADDYDLWHQIQC